MLSSYCADMRIRRQFFLEKNAAPLDTPVSLYQNYSASQLDMRRKAEILKYRTVAQTSQKHAFARAAKALVTRSSAYVGSPDCNQNADFPTYRTTPMPASRSGVPGNTMLFYDPNIPLYMYRDELTNANANSDANANANATLDWFPFWR